MRWRRGNTLSWKPGNRQLGSAIAIKNLRHKILSRLSFYPETPPSHAAQANPQYLWYIAYPLHETLSSTVTYSVGGLILSNSGAVTANYWLSEIYDSACSSTFSTLSWMSSTWICPSFILSWNSAVTLCKMEQKAYDEALTAFQAGMNVENCTIMQTLKFNEIVI